MKISETAIKMYRPNFYESACLRCKEIVYQVDRIGPLKDFTFFHTGCFKCRTCGSKLTLKTYFNSQHNQDDKEVSSRKITMCIIIFNEMNQRKTTFPGHISKSFVSEIMKWQLSKLYKIIWIGDCLRRFTATPMCLKAAQVISIRTQLESDKLWMFPKVQTS